MSRALLLGLLAFLVLCLLCISCHAPRIVADKASTALEQGSFDPAFVAGWSDFSLDGVDLDLAGVVDSEEARHRAGALVAAIPGVRAVNNGLTLASVPTLEPSAAMGAAGPLGFDPSDKGLRLRGSVPSEDFRTALKAVAYRLWGDSDVVDELVVDPTVDTGCWPESFDLFLEAMRSRGRTVKVSLAGCSLTVEGSVLSELEKQRILGSFASALPGVEVVDRLAVRAAETSSERTQVDLDAILATEIVEFQTGSDQLTPRGRQVLDRIALILASSDGRYEISGHTDSTGNFEFNLDLSRRRAETVRGYLVSKGVSGDRFDATGFGSSQPIATNATPEGRQKNRRTEFRAL